MLEKLEDIFDDWDPRLMWLYLVWHKNSIVRSDPCDPAGNPLETYDYALECLLYRANRFYGEEWVRNNRHTATEQDENHFIVGDKNGGYSIIKVSEYDKMLTGSWDIALEY
jgi:hypothetical protein